MALHWVTYFHAMQVAGVAIGMLALYTFPVITVLLEPFFQGTRLAGKDIIAALIVVIGIALMASDKFNGVNASLLSGLFWGVISALLFSLRNLIQKYHLAHISTDKSILHQFIAVALVLFCFVDYQAVGTLSVKDIWLLLALGIFTTAGAHTLLVAALKHLPVKTVAMLGCLQPVIGALLAWLVLDEVISLSIVVGGSIVLLVALYESVRRSP